MNISEPPPLKVQCPHCSQRLSIDAHALQGARSFNCPVCSGHVIIPKDMSGGDDDSHLSECPSDAPSAEEIPASFDSRYEIRRLVGRGGMGAVYEGYDARLARRVAIKILPKDTGADPGALARFEREAKAMAALDHPNIVHIHDYGQTPDGNPYFVMEYIDGMDVHKLRLTGQLDLPGALELVSQVCAALQYAHSRGIVHRDIKPGNILVNREGVAKVADFGLAKVLGTETQPFHEPSLTRSGTALGTPDYMAPEQFEGSHVDHRADIYSLGVMLYDLLTGSPPRGAWPPPSQRVQIDVRLDEIVLRALQQNPSARYQAASEVRADIDSVKSTTGGGPLPPGMDPAPLPSSVSTSSPIQAPAATGGASRPKQSRAQAQPVSVDETTDVSGLNTTMLILGLLSLAIIGGLAFYLAQPGRAGTQSNRQTVVNTESHKDIPSGMTAEDLKEVGDIWLGPYGFIGISMEALEWEQAVELAKRTGAEVLSIDEADPQWPSLHEWLRGHFAAPLAMQAWVRKQGEPHLLDSEKILAPETAESPGQKLHHKVMLHWRQKTSIPSNPPIDTTPPRDPPPIEIKAPPEPLQAEESAAPHPPEDPIVPAKPPEPPSPPSGPLPWTNTDGKTIEAEFIRLDGRSVVIRKDGKQFTIPLAKLSPESRKQALDLAGQTNPASE